MPKAAPESENRKTVIAAPAHREMIAMSGTEIHQ